MNRLLGVVLVGLLVRLIFLLVYPQGVVSVDLHSWGQVATLLNQGVNPYQQTTVLNWPPFWMQILYGCMRLSQLLHVPFIWIVKLFLIAIEVLLIVVVHRSLRHYQSNAKTSRLLLTGIALNPICVLLVCQHGNFDVLVALWIALFLAMLLAFHRTGEAVDWLLACLFLGLGILTKTVPLILAPLCFSNSKALSRRTKGLGACLVFGPTALGLSVLFVLSPEAVWNKVIAYHSFASWFGISGVLAHWGMDQAIEMYAVLFILGVVSVMLGLSWRLLKGKILNDRQLVLWTATLLMAIPTFGPGYGPQYLYWFIPPLLFSYILEGSSWRKTLLVGYAIAAGTYLIEYALTPSHGPFLTLWFPTPRWIECSQWLSNPWNTTLLRMPLFIAYLVTLHKAFALTGSAGTVTSGAPV